MIYRLALVLAIPPAVLLCCDTSRAPIVASLAGSVLIAAVAQTRWFQQSAEEGSATDRLMRPVFTFNLFFTCFHVLGGACAALNAAGFEFFQRTGAPSETELASIATAQQLMLLGQAGVNVGMR